MKPTTNGPSSNKPLCLPSFDVEEHFHIEAARRAVPRHIWSQQPSRLRASIDWILNTLQEHNAKATFFILGWVARRNPQLVADIAQQGHEIACHGDTHDRLHNLDPNRFRRDLETARASLQDAAQQPVVGYRAPTFSITRKTYWAVDVLTDSGFVYDSSVMPTRHQQYGDRSAPTQPYRLIGESGDWIAELPPLTYQLGPLRLAVAGGAYFRFLPSLLTRRGIAQSQKTNHPAVLYFHPWEFDPDIPRLKLTTLNHIRTYTGLKRTKPRLQKLLANVNSSSIYNWLATVNPADWPIHTLAPALNISTEHEQPAALLNNKHESKKDPNLKVA